MAFLNRQKGTRQSFGHKVLAFVTSISMVLSMVVFPVPASADEGDGSAAASSDASSSDAPQISKTLDDYNESDGSYKLTLSVTGKSKSSSTSNTAHVIFLLDLSSSMNNYASYVEDNNGSYGLVDGAYVELNYSRGGYYYTDTNGNSYWYYGKLYSPDTAKGTRLDAAKAAITGSVPSLLNNNTDTKTSVDLSLVTFGTRVRDQDLRVKKSTDAKSFNSSVNSTTAYNGKTDYYGWAEGGTNWEAGLQKSKDLADELKSDGGDVYIIFVTDGEPTYRNSKYSPYADDSHFSVYGTGNSDPNNWNRDAANEVAQNIADAKYQMYKVFAFGTSTGNATLRDHIAPTDSSHFMSADSGEALSTALANIVKTITHTHAYTKVSMTDTLNSDAVEFAAPGDANQFTYTTKDASGQETTWTDAPAASVNGNTVTWDISKDKNGNTVDLQDGVTYSVSFRVKPKQQAFDDAADLASKHAADSSVTTSGTAFIDDYGQYAVYSNTAKDNVVNYTPLTVTTGNGEPTRTEGKPGKESFGRPTMPIPVSTITVNKTWHGNSSSEPKSLEVSIKQGDKPDYRKLTLSPDSDGNWSGQAYVSAGPDGHNYTVTETVPSGWTLESYQWGTDGTNQTGATGNLKGVTKQNATVAVVNKEVVYSVCIHKYTKDGDSEKSIEGAEFTIAPDGTTSGTAKTTDRNGDAKFESLAPGTYKVVETKVPTGYQKLASDYTLVITPEGKATLNGVEITDVQDAKDNSPKCFTIKVSNNTIKNLPSTGGFGVWPMLAGGVALVAAGIAFVIVRKREQ